MSGKAEADRVPRTMCMLNTACEMVLLGILSLVKNGLLLNDAVKSDHSGGQRSAGKVFNIVYYALSAIMALWLILAVLASFKTGIPRYSEAAQWRALLCLFWQMALFFWVGRGTHNVMHWTYSHEESFGGLVKWTTTTTESWPDDTVKESV
uniref:Uncharacterized protein n=1 Tax=Rhipicephalus zambeziensis TaxID=60191 RepID=A0A224Y6I8_9ACAR